MTVQVSGLTKTYGQRTVVNDLTFDLEPGRVVGFLGPNGSGKSTTMKMMLGLVRPNAGSVTWDGRPYTDISEPARTVGALLDAAAVEPQRSARDHLRTLALCSELPAARVGAVLEMTGLGDVADEKVGGYSLGMHQRLGIAGAMLGDPSHLLFDEPSNGLDPEGIRWQRDLFRGLASEGKSVFVSSHLLAELAHVVDHLVVIGKGQLIREASVAEFTEGGAARTRVRSPRAEEFIAILRNRHLEVDFIDEVMLVSGAPTAVIGDLAAAEGIPLHELCTEERSLEDAFLEATAAAQEYRSQSIGTEGDQS